MVAQSTAPPQTAYQNGHTAGAPDLLGFFTVRPAAPFPVDVFPEPVYRFHVEAAAALGCPVDMIAGPHLAFTGAVIGNRLEIELKQGFTQRPTLFVVVVAPPGSYKTPAFSIARAPLDILQGEAFTAYEAARAQYESDLAAWKISASDDKGEQPEKPVLEHYQTTDATMEAIAPMLLAGGGLAYASDELASWALSQNAYRGGRGGDRQSWMSLWALTPLKIDRRTREPVYIPNPVVTVCGGIQPDMLAQLADEAGRRDGFIERLCWVFPDVQPAVWNSATTDQATTDAVADVYRRLRHTMPGTVRLSDGASVAWVDWYNENAALTATAAGLTQGIFAKLSMVVARVALILHSLTYPDRPISHRVTAETMLGAIRVGEYFRSHAQRVMPHFGAYPSSHEAGLLARVHGVLTDAAGEWVSRTAIRDALHRNADGDDIAAALTKLQEAGLAETQRVAGESGGRPAELWRVIRGDNAPRCPKCGGTDLTLSVLDNVVCRTCWDYVTEEVR